MRDPQRIDQILSRIRRIWLALPDMRLGQMLANGCSTGQFDKAFYYEDDKLAADLKRLEEIMYTSPKVSA